MSDDPPDTFDEGFIPLTRPTVNGFRILPLSKDVQIKQLEQNLAEAKQCTADALAEVERLKRLVNAHREQRAVVDLPFTERYD